MKKLLGKIKVNKKYFLLPLLILAVVVILLPKTANADVIDTAVNTAKLIVASPILLALGTISVLIMGIFGALNMLVISFIVNIVQYNNFINEPSIRDAWVIVRDLCNMFFILILLVVAFATILRIESYQWKKILPKLLIMAVLINFSRTICGLIIDASQVIMLTFTNAFGSGGNFINMTQMASYFTGTTFNNFTTSQWSVLNVVIGMMIGIMFMIISGIVLTVCMCVFLMRIVMLWIYIVLSPLAFLAMAFPAGQKYATQWWSEFVKYIINGPVLAFFIWMAMITSQQKVNFFTNNAALKTQCFGSSQIMCLDNFMPYILSIGMLLGGLMVTQQIGGVGSSMAGKGLEWAKGAAKLVGKGAIAPTKLGASYLNDKLHQKTGVDLNVPRVWAGIQAKRESMKKLRYGEGVTKAAEAMRDGGRLYGALAMTGTPGQAFEQLTTRAGWQRRIKGGIEGQKEIEPLATDRDASKKAIENIQTSDEYKNAEEISKAMLPSERVKMEGEQPKLTAEINALGTEIASLEAAIKTAKDSHNLEAEANATDKLQEAQSQKDEKLSNFNDNREKLKTKEYNVFDIIKAKKLLETKNNDIADHKKNIKDKNAEILKYKPIDDFDAIAMQGTLENEEMKKIDHIKDREELASMGSDAMKNKNKFRFNAIALKLAKDGNENDGLLNHHGFNSNADGLNKLMEAISNKDDKEHYMGYSDQEAKALGMKVSYAAEGNNHWATARAFTMEDGRYRNSTDKEQAMAAISEIAKMDPQGASRSLNRLGYGGETPDGKFILNDFGLALLKTIGPKIAEQMSRFNVNAAPRLNTPENIKLMIEAKVAPEFISKLQKPTATATKIISAVEAVNERFK